MSDTKVCPKCKVEKPLTPEFWYKSKKSKYGFRSDCKECGKMATRQWAKDNPDKKRLADIRYYEENHDKVLDAQRRWREKNRAKYRMYMRKWLENNREKHSIHEKKWRTENPEKYSEMKARWNKANQEKIKKQAREWRYRNPEKATAIIHKRRALKLGNGGSYTVSQIRALRLEQNNCCYHCSVSFDEKKMTIDHWIPLSRGGSNDISNIKLLCQHCNYTKHNKLPWEWNDRYFREQQK